MWATKERAVEEPEVRRRFAEKTPARPVVVGEDEEEQATCELFNLGSIFGEPSATMPDARNDTATDCAAIQKKKKRWLRLTKAVQAAGESEDDQGGENTETLNTNASGSSFSSLFGGDRQMKVVLRQFGSPPSEVMHVEKSDSIPVPESPNHVVIKVQASTVTLNDCLMRRGHCFDVINPTCLPLVPGHDVVGKIVSAGSAVQEFKDGDRVAALVRTGGNARYCSVHSKTVVRVPQAVDAAEAACMVSVYSAAYQSLKVVNNHGPMFSLKGKKVLVVGGMDGIGQALIQMCNKARADVYATAPSRRHGYIRSVLGATPLSENPHEWIEMVEGQMDVVFDGVCNDGLKAAKQALNKGGELVCFGYSSILKEEMGVFGAPMTAHLNRWFSHTQAKCIDIWDIFEADPEMYKKHLTSLFQLLKWNKLRPHIAKRVGLSDVAFAHSKLESGEVRGTVICMPWKRVGARNVTEEGREE